MTWGQRLKFWWYRKTHGGVPSPAECSWVLKSHGLGYNRLGKQDHIVWLRSVGFNVYEISLRVRFTRERIRQILLKECKLAKQRYKTRRSSYVQEV